MKTYKAMEALDAGELLEVTASDPAFGRDVRAWAKKQATICSQSPRRRVW
ncbi:protein containing SirA-like domain [methanotrophic bacterial endosymbiont of Bathymodiolus sp.]|nr:protein containing SirA-like domain [methanotrophic bacterial endosymbiont of Bathymodiolus sp.]